MPGNVFPLELIQVWIDSCRLGQSHVNVLPSEPVKWKCHPSIRGNLGGTGNFRPGMSLGSLNSAARDRRSRPRSASLRGGWSLKHCSSDGWPVVFVLGSYRNGWHQPQ